MAKRPLSFSLAALGVSLLLAGCGGAGSGSSKASLSKATAQKRAVATTRIMRATFGMAGLGRRTTRAVSARPACPCSLPPPATLATRR